MYMYVHDILQLNTISNYTFRLSPSKTMFSKSQTKARYVPSVQHFRIPRCVVSTPLASLQTQVLSEKEEEEPRTSHEMLSVIKFPGGNRKSAAELGWAGEEGRGQNTPQEAQVKGDGLWLLEPGAEPAMHQGSSACPGLEQPGSAPTSEARTLRSRVSPSGMSNSENGRCRACGRPSAAPSQRTWHRPRGGKARLPPARRRPPPQPPALGPGAPRARPPAAVRAAAAAPPPARQPACGPPAPPPYLAKQYSQWFPRSLTVST